MNALILLAAISATCPPSIDVKQEVNSVEGWTVHGSQSAHRYYFAQFSDGPPSREAILMHDAESKSGEDKILRYQFLESQEPWLICSYTGTSAVLARKLPKATRSCQLALDHVHNFETVKAISCK